MKAIETNVTVGPDGRLIVQSAAPDDVAPGVHRAVLVIDEGTVRRQEKVRSPLPVLHVGSWPADIPLRREDMYDERGR